MGTAIVRIPSLTAGGDIPGWGNKEGLSMAEKAVQWGLELMGASTFDQFKVQAGSRIMEFGP